MSRVTIGTGTCLLCGKHSAMDVAPEMAQRIYLWRNDLLPGMVQEVFAELTPGQREQLINGSHEACFDAAFPEED